MSQHDTLTLEQLDQHLDAILKASGSALRHYTMQKSRDDMRAALRAALSATQPAQAAQSEPVKPLFASKVAARKWAELQEQGARMQSIAFDGGKGGAGTIDPWGVVRWGQAAQGEPATDAQTLAHNMLMWVEDAKQHRSEYVPIHVATLEKMIGHLSKQQAAQGAGEVVPYAYAVYFPDQPTEMLAHDLDDLCEDMTNREHTVTPLYTQPASGADVPPAQPAPVVPDGWKLVPIKCTEAMKDVGGQFEFATISDGRLLAQSMWNELLCATPTPPAQAAADARDAILFESSRWGGADCRLAVWESLRILGSRMGVTVTKEDQYTALATHQHQT